VSAVKQEPVVTASSVLAVIGAGLGYATSHGLITETQASGWTQLAATVVPFALPLVVGAVTRRYTSPAQPPEPPPKP
jgi:hypothetical protein